MNMSKKVMEKRRREGYTVTLLGHFTKSAFILTNQHCMKRVCILNYSGPHFPAFGMNRERYSISLCIQSYCGNMRTRITPNTDNFYALQEFQTFGKN